MGNRTTYQTKWSFWLSCIKSVDDQQNQTLSEHKSKSVSDLKDIDGSSDDIEFVRSFVPERYLVLLSEDITEMLFQLLNFSETSMNSFNSNNDRRLSIGFHSPNTIISTGNSTRISSRSLSQLFKVDHVCLKCKMKMLTIEEFHQLLDAFRNVDADRDNFLSRDEIRTTLHHLFDLTEMDVKEIISVFDTNRDDRISLAEYIGARRYFVF